MNPTLFFLAAVATGALACEKSALVGKPGSGGFGAGTGGGSGTVAGPGIDGLRTDPNGRALVAAYTGGACDGEAQLQVTESAEEVARGAEKAAEQPGYGREGS